MPREWDAKTYDELRLPHEEWGRRVVERLAATGLRGDELVLDAGCGTGRDAELLRKRWPGIRLIALDGSRRMLDVARERLGPDGVEYRHADLARPLDLDTPVDAVVSVAAFHWVRDHDALFGSLARAMRVGATLTSDCGGRGNVAAVNAAIARVTGVPNDEWQFADAQDTRTRLERAGFEVVRCELRADPFRIDDPRTLDAFLGSVVLGTYLAALPGSEHPEFVSQVRLALEEPVIDYVRLEIDAVLR